MEDINKKLFELKENIFNTTMESRTEENASVNKLIAMDSIDRELKEILILLTNNYTAELQAIRHHHVRSLIHIIDLDMALLNKYKEMLVEVEKLKEEKEAKLFTYKNALKGMSVVFTTTLFFTILYHLEPVAVEKAVSAMHSLLTLGLKALTNLI